MDFKRFLIGFVVLVFVVGFGTIGFAEEYTNIGFKEDVPKELKQKFLMCEEFLDVKWIDEKRYMGKLKAAMFYRPAIPGAKRGGNPSVDKIFSPEKKDEFTFLVFSNRDYSTYGISEEEYSSKKFEEFIRNAEIGGTGYFLYAIQGKKKFETTSGWRPFHPKGDEKFVMTSFAHYTKNICLLYPNEESVLIVEDKKPFQNDDMSPELKQKNETVMKFAEGKCNEIIVKEYPDFKCDLTPARYGTLIDVNNDSREDYYFWFKLNGPPGKGVYIMRYVYLLSNDKPKFMNAKCEHNGLYFYLRAEAKDILCTLSELTKDKTNKGEK